MGTSRSIRVLNWRRKILISVQIHLFGEGKVCQSGTYRADPQTGIARLRRFRWGMCVIFFPSPFRAATYQLPLCVCSGRILMETHRLPTIIPMWITGTSISHDPRPPQQFPQSTYHAPRRPDTQGSTSSCQKDVAHLGNSSRVPAPA